MKKSNVLMFSYVVFLVLTIVVHLGYGWDGLNQIALAASSAGFFFAFADLSNWYVSCFLPHSKLFLENINYLKKYDATIDELDNNTKKQANEIIEMLQDRVEYDPSAAEIVQQCKEHLTWLEQDESNESELKDQVDELILQSEKTVAKFNRYKSWELGFAYLGFLVFFSLTSFDELVGYIKPYESIITVSSFSVIILTYFLRDTIDEIVQKKCDKLHEDTEKLKQDIAEMESKVQNTRLSDRVKEVAEMIEKENQQKEVAENG